MSTSSSKSTQQIDQSDRRRVLGEGAISSEGVGNTINVLDNGAVNNSLALTDSVVSRAFTFGGDTTKAALAFTSTTLGQLQDAQRSQTALIKDAFADAKGRGALTDYIIIGAIAIAGIVAYAAVKK